MSDAGWILEQKADKAPAPSIRKCSRDCLTHSNSSMSELWTFLRGTPYANDVRGRANPLREDNSRHAQEILHRLVPPNNSIFGHCWRRTLAPSAKCQYYGPSHASHPVRRKSARSRHRSPSTQQSALSASIIPLSVSRTIADHAAARFCRRPRVNADLS